MKTLSTIDNIAGGLIIASAVGSAVAGGRKDTPSRALRAMRVAVSAAGLYQLIRSLKPKTAEERRADKVNELYGQAEQYAKRAKTYQQAAQKFLRTHYKTVKAITPS